MEGLSEKLKINHPSFEWVENYFKENPLDVKKFTVTSNDLIYHNEKYPKEKNVLIKISDSKLNVLNNPLLIEKLEDCVNYLKSIYELKLLWIMIYPPKKFLNFHKDYGLNRHVISFTQNDRFFNYEVDDDLLMSHNFEIKLNEKFQFHIDTIDDFNDYFVNIDKSCKINVLNSNSVYTFGNTLHTFYNGSDKIRVNFVFEIVE